MYVTNQTRAFKNVILNASKKYDVPPDVITGVIMAESDGDPNAVNPNPLRPTDPSAENSRGLMQITERTAKSELGFGVMTLNTLFDPKVNIDAGTRLLRKYYNRLSPLFDSKISEYEKWKITTNTYNQGTKYWGKALKQLKYQNVPQTFDKVQDVLLQMSSTPAITKKHAQFYGDKAMRYAVNLSRKTPGPKLSPISNPSYTEIAIWSSASIGVLGLFYMMTKKD